MKFITELGVTIFLRICFYCSNASEVSATHRVAISDAIGPTQELGVSLCLQPIIHIGSAIRRGFLALRQRVERIGWTYKSWLMKDKDP